MALEDIGRGAKKLVVPVAATLAGAGAGLVLTRKSVRKAMPDVGNLGNIADDLRTKLESVVGKGQQPSRDGERSDGERSAPALRQIDPSELDQRLREREQRRKARRTRS
jgi:hypothetical protein